MEQMIRWRAENGLHFEIQNQIHDALMLHVPKDEVEETKAMFHATMGNIHIPLKGTDFEHTGGPDFFTLGVDIDVYERWGKKI